MNRSEVSVGSPFKAYLAVYRTQLKTLLHFKTNLLAWVIYSPLQMAVIYLLWKVIYSQTDTVKDFTFEDMIRYYLIVHLLNRTFGSVLEINYRVWVDINKGKLDIYLARPLNFGLFTLFKAMGKPSIEWVIGIPFFIFFCIVLSIPLQINPWVLASFLLSVFAGFGILFLIQFMIGSLAFWTERIFGIRDIIFSIFMLFSGQLIPVSVLPKWIQAASQYLPFEGIFYMPATIYAQPQVNPLILFFLIKQFVWVCVLTLMCIAVWQRGSTRYASQGG